MPGKLFAFNKFVLVCLGFGFFHDYFARSDPLHVKGHIVLELCSSRFVPSFFYLCVKCSLVVFLYVSVVLWECLFGMVICDLCCFFFTMIFKREISSATLLWTMLLLETKTIEYHIL